MTEQERNRRKKVAASLVANNMDSEEKARRKKVADDLIKNNSITTSPSVTSTGSGDIYAAGALRRQTNVNNAGDLKMIEADKKARAFVNANRGRETAYLGTGTNGSTGKINYVVTTKGGTAPTATANTVPVSEYLHNDIEKKKNTSIIEESLKMPVSKSRMPGTAVNQNVGVHVETDKTKSKAGQIADITKKVADDEYFKSDIDRKKAAENRIERVSTEYTEKYNNMSADSKALLSFINREEETKTNINWMGIAAGFSGQSGSNAAAAGQYAASLTTSQEARRMLRDLYGMTDDEIDAAVILHERSRNAEIAQRQDEEMKRLAQENPHLASALSVPMAVTADVTSTFDIADNIEKNNKAKALGMGKIGDDPNGIYSAHRRMSDTLLNTRASDIEQKHGKLAAETYLGAMGGITNAAEGFTFGKATEGVLTVNAGVSAYRNAKQKGLPEEDCVKTMAVAMVAEFIGEHIGGVAFRGGKKLVGKTLSDFLEKGFTTKTLKGLLATTAKTAIPNGLEEGLTSAINLTYDYYANGDLSDYQMIVDNNLAEGKTLEEAEQQAKKEIAESVLTDIYSGTVAGLIFNAGNVADYGINQASLAATGKYAKSADMTNAIIAEGQAAPAGSKAQKLADKLAKKQESGKKVSSYKIGQLAESNAETKSKATAEESEKMSTAFKQKLYRELAEVDRAEATNPKLVTESGDLTVDGGNFDSKTQQLGEFKGIFKDKDGDNSVKTTDGQEIKVSELTGRIENKTVARLYEQTEGMSAEAANLFIDNWDGETIGEYKRAFDYYYKMGRTGMKIDDIRANDNIFGSYISAEAQTKIANAGLYGREFRKGLTDLSVARKDNRYKYESKVLQLIGEKNNLEIFILDEDSNINGKYLEGTNRIVVYRNAEGRIITRTAGHESFHFIKNQATDEASKAEVKALSDLVLDALEKNGMDVEAEIERLGAIADNEGNLVYKTREDCIEEIVANGMFDVFTNEKFAKKLLNENRSVFGKLANKIKEIVKEIKSAIAMLGNSDSVIKALKDDVDTLDKINSMFDELLTKAGEKYKAEHENGQKNNAVSGEVKNSFAAARKSRSELIAQAEALEKDGETKEDIWKKVGLIRDASGIWVYEIDDSSMKIYPNGDARLRNEKGYKRMTALLNKAFVDGVQLTETEQNEYRELNEKYNTLKKISVFLSDFVSHDKLFKEYPELNGTSFEFDDLKSRNARGYYDHGIKAIVLDNSLRKQIEARQLDKTTIHEIQHALQHIDGRAAGASPEYWAKKNVEKLHEMQNNLVDMKAERASLFANADNELRRRIREVNNADWYDINSDGKTEQDILRDKLLADDTTGIYKKSLDMDFEIQKLEAELEYFRSTATAEDMYYNTAGEIEARETANRLRMTAEERTEKMPDLGWERAVFAEGSERSASYVQFNDNENIIELVEKVKSGKYKDNETVDLGVVDEKTAEKIKEILGVDVKGYMVKIEARQMFHILKDHGENGVSDHSMANDSDIAKMEYALKNYDEMSYSGKTQAYSYMRDGSNRTAETILYEKDIGNKSYYVVQAVPVAKKKTLFIVSAFIGPHGYKKGASQLINTSRGPNVTAKTGSVVTPNNIISKDSETVKEKLSMKSSADNLSELKEKRSALTDEYRALRMQIDEIKESAEYVSFNDEVRAVKKNGSLFGKMEKVKEIRSRQKAWADSKGLSELEERYYDISEQIHDYDLKIYKLDKAQKEKVTAELTDKVKSFSNAEIRNYAMKATEKFGVTDKFDNAGYMLTDGKLLDFSDGHGYRVLDHREIKDVLDFLPDNGNRSDGLIQFMNMGNIRMQIGGIDISRAPGKEQIPVLRKFFNENNGEITVDFSKENGDNAGSIEYPRGTSSTKILNDIKEYFEKGTLPQISATAAFHSMYSVKRTSPAQRQIDILYENRNLKQIISLIDELHYSTVTSDVRLKTKDINLVAKKMLKNLKSKYDVGTLTDELAAVYNYMENSTSENSADEARRALIDLAFKMLEQSEMKDTELYDQYKDVRDYLRNQPIYITPELKKEIEHQFGDYKSFRNALMGKVMHMTTSDSTAPTLDEVWQELSEKAPEYFAKDFNEKDMPLQLAAFFEAIAPKVVNSYEHYSIDVNEVAPIVAEQLQMEYAKIKKVTSKHKDYQDLVFKSNQDFIKAKKAYYEELKQKSAQNKAELYKDYQNKLEEYKSAREETDRRRVLKNRLERNYNYVNRRLVSETDSRHVPENLKKLAEAFKRIVPDSNKTFHESDFVRFENEYRALDNDEFVFFDSNMLERIIAMKEVLCTDDRELKMRELNIEQLEELNNIAEHIKHIVQKENQLFSDRTNASVEDFALNVHGDTQYSPEHYAQEIPDMKYKGKSKDRFRNSIDSFIKGLIKPEYLFSLLGSDTMKFLFDEMRRGENVEAQIIAEAKKYEQETKEKYNYDPRWKNKTIEIELESGKISMTVESAMALYATSKRRQGLQHLLDGGAVIYTKKEIAKDAKTYTEIRKEVIKAAKKNKEKLSIKEIDRRALEEYQKNGEVDTEIVHRRHYFDKKDIPKIAEALSIDQKQYTDAMVNYITNVIGKKRNEVSMKMFGIEKYKEPYYFPIDVDSHFIDTSIGRQEVVSTIKNQSSSKRTANYAKNPISINSFTDTINNHIYDSALYCAYVVPISDFKRVFNYRGNEFEGEGVESLVTKEFSVKEDLEKANGINAVNQIKDFMLALDSGSRYENLIPVSAKLAARAKKVSVMANLSVVVQQPTAVFRAMLYVDPKYFATTANKADIAEMKKWNGCALKKEVGYFDVNMGRTATDYINEYSPDKSIKKDWNLKDYLQNSNTMLAIDQVAGWGASKADEMTWGAIWKACKKKIKADNSELEGDALNTAASELFQTVISKTQVYDSVFTKPDYMRRKEGFAMLATQFMSEPLTSLNMLTEAVVQARRAKGSTQQKAARKFCSRAFACYMTSVVVNSALKSLVYSMRDDDEDESFLEKYVANVVGEFIPEALGFTMIPYVKDILSIVQGYSLERADVAVFSSFKDAIDALGSEKKGAYDKIMAVLKAAGQASGIPAYAVIRDGKAIYDIFDKIVDGVQNGFEPTTGRGIINELKETFDWVPGIDPENKYDQLYSAIVEKDEKHYKKVYDNLIAGGKEEGTINSEIASILAEKDSRIAATYEATAKGDTMTASSKVSELKEAGYSEDVINRALHNYESNLREEVKEDERIIKAAEARYNMDYDEYERIVNEMVSEGYSEIIVKDAINSEKIELETKADEFTVEEKELYTASYDLKNAFINGDKSDVRTVYNKLLKETDKDDAASEVRKYAKSAYKDSYISEGQLKSYLTEYKTDDTDENDIFWEVEEIKGGDDYRKYGKLYDAIDNGRGFSSAVSYYIEHGIELKTVKSDITKKYKPKLMSLTPGTSEYKEMYENVIDAFVATGDSEAEAKKKVNKWYN